MARPADWLDPIDKPAMAAAHQNWPLVAESAAITRSAASTVSLRRAKSAAASSPSVAANSAERSR